MFDERCPQACWKHVGITFLETSAVTGENIQEVFTLLSKTILNKIEGGKCI